MGLYNLTPPTGFEDPTGYDITEPISHSKMESISGRKDKQRWIRKVSRNVLTPILHPEKIMASDIKKESPVVAIVPFDSEEEVIKRANGVQFGLAAVVWSENLSRTHRVSKRLQAGTVWCNCWLVRDLNMPFGGVKASGIGREGAKESYEFYTEVKKPFALRW
ncbi:Aldehyde dehydrogenase 8 member A1 [Desmophyllum pertusum]|uniref:Aldehyde dehydrogenase 8 member A1 n=1 Tax=Desmophyllum pertusum TaxID=174260 RepID=A0A9W9YXA8_9CNID|nr:Aldehyde dehydrogenase 8 member A1 [Desmophyllum pertusum]